jgi:Leucine-rich repeat (LRR) protein
LKTLQASGQNIQEITADTFQDGKNLVYIYLAENAITIIHKGTFANAGKLRVINLADNALTFLHKDTFEGEYYLYQLSVHLNILINLQV